MLPFLHRFYPHCLKISQVTPIYKIIGKQETNPIIVCDRSYQFYEHINLLYTINAPKISATSPLASVKGTLTQISKFHYVFGFI